MDHQEDSDSAVSRLTILLTKSILYREDDFRQWGELDLYRSRINDAVRVLGLNLVVDEVDGYAYLKTLNEFEDDSTLRLISRRQLTFHESLLLAILRKRLAEFEVSDGNGRLLVTTKEILDLMRVHYPSGTNEIKVADKIDALVNKMINFGFLIKIKDGDDRFRVKTILKSFVPADTLEQFLTSYQEYLSRGSQSSMEPPANIEEKEDGYV